MESVWPPSPSVEDEAAALAHEHLLDSTIAQVKSDDQPAGNRGTVNQYPIILDSDHEPPNRKEEGPKIQSKADQTPSNTQSSDESSGPATPPPLNRDRRFVHLPSQDSKASPPKDRRGRSRSKSRHRPKEETTPRGRPNVSRIRTDLGSDLPEMVTGNRRAPSPYAYKPGQMAAEKIQSTRSFSGEHLLSPQQAHAPRSLGVNDIKRPASAKPRSKDDDLESSTDSDKHRERRHVSRRRSTRKSISRSDRPVIERASTTAFEKRTPHQAPLAESSLLSSGLHNTTNPTRADVSQAPSRKTSKESPYNSSAEESRSRHHVEYVPRSDKRFSRDSPLTSSDESKSRRHRDDRDGEGRKSRRSSVHAKHRPKLDSSAHHHSYGGWESPVDKYDASKHRHDPKHHSVFDGRTYLEPITPSASRTPQTMEDVWEKAFRDNQAKGSSCNGRGSANPSPRTSPPHTPPRTTRADRRSKDFYELTSPDSQPAHQRSRPPSVENTLFKEPAPLAGVVAAAVAAPNATNFLPNLSRSSTSSVDMTSSGSLSKPSSGQRSRKPSPVFEDPRTLSRSTSYVAREERPVLKPSLLPNVDERPTSRSGLYAPTPTDHPGLPQRAFSYNAAVQPPISRPASSHRYSSGLLPTAVIAESVPKSTPSRPSRPPLSPIDKAISTTAENVGAVLPPPCPRSVARAGYADWYTIKGIPEINICPSCMGIMGGSRFRDHFIPSMSKPRNQEVKCSMSLPWIRVAWVQIAKQNRPTLEMMWKLTHLPTVTRPCPGRKFETRPWYRLVDPQTGRPVSNFDVCSACVHHIDHVFPDLEGALERTDLVQELGCNLNADSKRFFGYISEFDKAHGRCRGERFRKGDIQALADYARRVSRVRECARDGPLLTSAWHFHPDLPDFTICEECFDEVVWPVADKPVARNVNRALKIVPTRPGQYVNGRTCQLYSERMRKLFLEAVKHNDFEILRIPALKRLNVEQLLQEQHGLQLRDMKAGLDRKAEIERNIQIWKTWE